ncbi:MAG: hypothetical protein JWN57_1087 [Frankiales bacterium]|jgi:hypothetical protein|nr:hypothetical protein [Frankiales bacterium]
MCRSIKTLRPPYTEPVTEQDIQAAALQYVRKIAGMRAPSTANAAAFAAAVQQVAAATETLLAGITVRPAPRRTVDATG